MIEAEGPLKAAAYRRAATCRIKCVDDMIQSARLAVWEATRVWLPTHKMPWHAYAYVTAKGAVLMESWRNGPFGVWAGRAQYQKGYFLPGAVGRSWSGQWGAPDDGEPADHHDSPHDSAAAREIVAALLSALPDSRDAECLRLVYCENLTTREVGDRVGVTSSRVSQICREALARVRLAAQKMGLYEDLI